MNWTKTFHDWGIDRALPFWVEHAWDSRHGGFLESLTTTAEPVMGDRRRVRTQARQIFVFAKAHHAGWGKTLPLAEEGWAVLRQRAHAVDGKPGWVKVLADNGDVLDPARDLYDHAFVLLAASWLYRASGKAEYRAEAEAVLEFLDREMAEASGGYAEQAWVRPLPRRQNPHMHLLEALLALYDATGDQALLPRLDALIALFEQHFLCDERGVLFEYFTEDWTPFPGDDGRRIEPGHMVEWVWLLAEYARLNRRELHPAVHSLYRYVVTGGVNPQTGLLYTEMTASGEVLAAGSRSWMQTEAIRAARIMSDAGLEGASDQLEAFCRATVEHHISGSIPGGWVDRIDENGGKGSGVIPASILYHMMGAVSEARLACLDYANP